LESSERSACLRAGPLSIPRTRLAKFSEQMVSPTSAELGLIWTNIKVLQSPPAFHISLGIFHLQKGKKMFSNHKKYVKLAHLESSVAYESALSS